MPKPLSRLHGIVVPMITPLARHDSLDLTALEQLIEHLIGGGVHGLFILGSCGEGPSLGYDLRRELITRTCQQVNGRLPIVVGITDSSAAEADSMACFAADHGADGVVLAPPFYFPLDRDELIRYSRHRIQRSPLPVVLYNMPSLTKLSFDSECVRQLADESNVIAIKDSSGELDVFRKLSEAARVRKDWTVLVGPEHLLIPSLQSGGHGGVSGGANLFPRLFVEIYESFAKGSSSKITAIAEQAKILGQIYEIAGGGAASAVKALKVGFSVLGLGNDLVSEPLSQLDSDRSQKISAIVRNVELSLEGNSLQK